MKPKIELIRIVKTPENEIVLDSTGKKNGRGAYVCKDVECLKKIRKQKSLSSNFKMLIEDSIYDELEKELEKLGE